MADFKPIETQEDFDKIIQKRLEQKEREVLERFKDYSSPDDVAALKADFEKKIKESEDAHKKDKETFDAREKELLDCISGFTKSYRVKSRNVSGKNIDYVIELSVKDSGALFERLHALNPDKYSLIEYDNEDII
jgi:hypothetical protein